jgi:hypothetical protein
MPKPSLSNPAVFSESSRYRVWVDSGTNPRLTGEKEFVTLALCQGPVARDSGRRIKSVRSARHTNRDTRLPHDCVVPSPDATHEGAGLRYNG